MIWNNKILFIHTPKTAGMSISDMLLKSLDRKHGKIFYSGNFNNKKTPEVEYVSGKRHETLCDAESFFSYRNMSLGLFEKIFTVMRNPYDLELSRYSYLKKGLEIDRGPAQKIALECDFKEYLRKAPFFGMNPPRIHLYYTFNKVIPENLVVLKYENLNNHIDVYMSDYLVENYKLPFENSTSHKHYKEVYDTESEKLCFNRHRWFFEKGFYDREVFS